MHRGRPHSLAAGAIQAHGDERCRISFPALHIWFCSFDVNNRRSIQFTKHRQGTPRYFTSHLYGTRLPPCSSLSSSTLRLPALLGQRQENQHSLSAHRLASPRHPNMCYFRTVVACCPCKAGPRAPCPYWKERVRSGNSCHHVLWEVRRGEQYACEPESEASRDCLFANSTDPASDPVAFQVMDEFCEACNRDCAWHWTNWEIVGRGQEALDEAKRMGQAEAGTSGQRVQAEASTCGKLVPRGAGTPGRVVEENANASGQ